MYGVRDIKRIHLEITSKCNAACPQCARNYLGSFTDPMFDLSEIQLADFQRIFPEAFLKQLEMIYMCGTYGEPAVARDCLEIFAYARSLRPNLGTCMHTNGGVRTPDWWAKLAAVCEDVWFGIDGLEDTNHLYRQGVNWNRLMENVLAFTRAGGKATWVMNVFKHNEHQVEKCRALSQELGFKQFIHRKTARFYWPSTGLVDRIPVYDKDGRIKHYLEMPENPEYRNTAFNEDMEARREASYPEGPQHIQNLLKYKEAEKAKRRDPNFKPSPEPVPAEVKKQFDCAKIDCKAVKNGDIYLSASGLLWPCCFLSVNEWGHGPMQARMDEVLAKVPEQLASLDTRKHSLEEIVASPFFQKSVPESWDKPSIEAGKLYDCAYWCKKEDAFFEQEYSNNEFDGRL